MAEMDRLALPLSSETSASRIPLTALSDEELFLRVQERNYEALGILFRRYYKVVLSIAFKIVRDAGEAEDVLQEVFLELLRKCHLFDPAKGRAKTWIFQYAYSTSINRRQHLTLRRFYSDQGQPDELPGRHEPSCLPEALTHLSEREQRESMQRALAALNSKQQQVLSLAYFDGLTMKEIAKRTGESFANVRNHYYRGVRKLRDTITNGAQSSKEAQLHAHHE
jgi:RNA polymerase sigma-70 factor (ECF subfamily)